MGLLALAVVPALVLEDRATDPAIRTAAHLTNWVVWLAFCGELLGRMLAWRHRPGGMW